MRNIKLFVAFCELKDEVFAIVGKNQKNFEAHINAQKKITEVLGTDIYQEEFVVRSKKNKDVHDSVSIIFKDKEDIIVVNNIGSIEQLECWFKIMNDSFIPVNEAEKFLKENGLLKKWISGKLEYIVGEYYQERSKELGFKSRYTKHSYQKEMKSQTRKLTMYDYIWNFSEWFIGKEYYSRNDFDYRYSYSGLNRIVEIRTDNIVFEVNQDFSKLHKEHSSWSDRILKCS